MKKLLSLLIFVSLFAAAQDVGEYSPKDYTIIPPSPEVASLMKYVDFPVSTFTGQPNIDIPIYTIRNGSLSLPISISYHGGGIKAFETSGIIGVGWSLNAGGCVSRTIHGLPDEFQANNRLLKGLYYLDDNSKTFRNTILNRNTDVQYMPYFDFIGAGVSGAPDYILPYSLCSNYNEGKVDVANDIFQFNFCGNMGSFIIEPEHKGIFISTSSKVSIENHGLPATGSYCSFYDEMGNCYEFEESERTCYNYNYLSGGTNYTDSIYCASSWHIKDIISTKGERINFEYIQGNRTTEYLGSTKSLYTTTGRYQQEQYVWNFSSSINDVDYYPSFLHRIVTPSTTMEFEYDDNYRNLIEIKVFRNGVELELIKRFRLNHLNGLGSLPINTPRNISTAFDKRYLSSIYEIGENGEELMLYAFTYNQGNNTTPKGYDYWGYSVPYENSLTDVPPFGDPDLQHSKIGVLESISYPTGGRTCFEWEQNDYASIGQMRLDNFSTTTTTINKYTLCGQFPGTNITNENIGNQVSVSRSINVIKNDSVHMYAYLYIKQYIRSLLDGPFGDCLLDDNSEYKHNHGADNADMSYPRIEITGPNGFSEIKYIDDSTCSSDSIFIAFPTSGTYTFTLKNPYNFQDVSASVVNEFFGSISSMYAEGDIGKIYISVTKAICQKACGEKWGGLRIKRIESCPNNGEAIVKSYSYRDDLQIPKSSGTISVKPNECYQSHSYKCGIQFLTPNAVMDDSWQTIDGAHSSCLYSTPCGGSHVEYPSVFEYISGDDNIVQYVYSSQRDYGCADRYASTFTDFIPGGQRIYTDYGFRRGDLISKNYFCNNTLKKTEKYSYRISTDTNTPKFCSEFHKITDVEDVRYSDGTPNGILSSDYTTSVYTLIPYNKSLSEKKISEFLPPSDEVSFDVTTTYTTFREDYHDKPWATFIRSECQDMSDGQNLTKYYSYINKNGKILNLKESEVYVKAGKVLSAIKYQYDSKDNIVATFRAPTGIDNRSCFLLGNNYWASDSLLSAINIPEYSYIYDNHNNLVEIDYNGEVLASYIWGYKDSHPVAELKGVSYSTALNTLQGRLNPETLRDLCDITVEELDNIRLYFPDNEVTTYTYDWLIGAGTMTDPRGITTTFARDSFGRLESVKDFNGYFIRKYDYHYQGQNN